LTGIAHPVGSDVPLSLRIAVTVVIIAFFAVVFLLLLFLLWLFSNQNIGGNRTIRTA
jgi:hypothetical protein